MIADQKFFNTLTAAFGNPFAAVTYISRIARKLSNSVDYHVLESQAISWVVSGVKPGPIKRSDTAKLYLSLPVEETLQLVDREDIKDAVIHSLQCSIYKHTCESNNTLYRIEDVPDYTKQFIADYVMESSKDAIPLVFCYGDIKEESDRARVRILTRMIWIPR